MDKTLQNKCDTAMREYPGMAADSSDKSDVSKKRVDARTKAQNNNPRNNDNPTPDNQGR